MKQYKVPDIQLEQYLLGELPGEIMREIEELIKSDPETERRVAELRRSGSDILAAYPAGIIAASILKRADAAKAEGSAVRADAVIAAGKKIKHSGLSVRIRDYYRQTSGRLIYSAAAAVTAAVVMFMIYPAVILNTGKTVTDSDVIRVKGFEPGISVYRQVKGGVEELKNLTRASQGDLLQIGYAASGDLKYGAILSIDGRGTVTLHYPDSESGNTEIKINKKVMLEHSYELDDSPEFERFILLLSDSPVDVKSAIKEAKSLAEKKGEALNGPLKISGNIREFSLVIQK